MPSKRQRGPRSTRRGVAGLIGLCVLALACSSGPGRGFYHKVRPGENLYRIGLRYGVDASVLIKANRIADVTAVPVGTRLWIPRTAVSKPRSTRTRAASPAPRRPSRASEARRVARLDAQRSANLHFGWPIRGKLTSRFGSRGGRPHDGLDLAARRGSRIVAAEAGRVIHSGRLGDYGNTVIVKHAGNYRTVYAHASKTLVRKGAFVEKGQPIALVGTTGRSTGPHLHFEIRRRQTPRDPMLYLP